MFKYIFLFCSLISTNTWAASILTKASLQNYFAASPMLEAEIKKHPDISQEHIQQLPFGDGGAALIKYFSKSKGYGKLNAIAKESGFKSLEDYVSVTYALVPALYVVQKEMYPDIPTVAEQRKALAAQKTKLVEQGLSQDLVNKAMETAEESFARQEEIERAATSVSKDDVKTIRANLDWIMEKMEAAAAE